MDAADSRVTTHVRITGLVQGVGYRYSCRAAAIERGVTGWVRNRPDGSVEGVFHGERSAVDVLLAWCKTGPPAARVSKVEAVAVPRANGDDFDYSRERFEIR